MIREQVKHKIKEALTKCYPDQANVPINVSEPSQDIDADLCSNVAMALAKGAGLPPAEVARQICDHLAFDGIIKNIKVATNGYINLHLDEKFLLHFIDTINTGKEKFLNPVPDPSKPRVLIEFVSANPTGPLHIGHGRGAALGDSLARIYKQLGYPVQTEYYINDVGVQMQILAESVKARNLELQERAEAKFPDNGYKGEYIREIAKIMQGQKREDFDRFPREYILDWIRKDLKQFGVEFNNWFSETQLHQQGKIQTVLELLKSKNSIREKDGAVWFVPKESEEKEIDQERVLRKSDGRYTYFASDVAYHQNKLERGFQYCIDIWGHDHHGYVPRVESAFETLGYSKNSLKILLYQLVSLKRGGKRIAMSTRTGEFVTLKEILDEVGRDACRFFFAMRSPNAQLEFDVDLAKKQSNENPVYYVQYVHARICSIFSEAQKRGIPIVSAPPDSITPAHEERELIKKLAFFEDTLEHALQISSPHLVTTYLLDCAAKFHKFYDQHRVLDAEPKVRAFRFSLLQCTQKITALGLSLLGVSAPEKM